MSDYKLEIVIYTLDGGTHRFYQDEDREIGRILMNLNPLKLFQQKQFTIAGSYFMAGFNAAHVTRVDLISKEIPPISHTGELAKVVEISPREMEQRALPRFSDPTRQEARTNRDGMIELYAEFSMADGHDLYLHIEARPAGRLDQRQMINSIFNGTGFHAIRRNGGLIIINPALISRWAFYPGLPDVPTNTWPAHRVDLRSDQPSLIFQKISAGELEEN